MIRLLLICGVLFLNCDPYTRSPVLCGWVGLDTFGMLICFIRFMRNWSWLRGSIEKTVQQCRALRFGR